ncbi:MAG: hypothetical protein GXY38_07080 [Planctomycetes bacterium]|jgi:hypothetical protein|nr:hypothetical protein [Planctomycetota bacterium]
MNLTRQEQVVRDLAQKVVAAAHSEKNRLIVKRWLDVNALRKPDRAPVWCRPVACWQELLPDESLVCDDPVLRDAEKNFRMILIKWDIDDDTPLETFYPLSAILKVSPPDIWGGRHRQLPNESLGAWKFAPVLCDPSDYDKLAMPTLTYDKASTELAAQKLSDVFGDILPVHIKFYPPYRLTLGTAAADLRGMEQMMMDMIIEPQLMHRLMAHLRDVDISIMDQAQKNGWISRNNTGGMYTSENIGPENKSATLENCWAAANSQEYDQVSPSMFEEFCLNYQMPLFKRFGLVSYGCCENLTHKVDAVLRIPNLRIFTCSAWTNLDTVLERISTNYCIMWRQKASAVVFAKDENELRRQLEEGTSKLRGRRYQIVLRELQTLAGNMDRLHVWTRLAKEAAEKYC